MDQADDLKAFERRMIEIVSSIQPYVWRWRLLLFVLILSTVLTFSTWIWSPPVSLILSPTFLSFLSPVYRRDVAFSLLFALLLIALLFGVHRKIFATSVILGRSREVLADYNMSCDARGRLILKARRAI